MQAFPDEVIYWRTMREVATYFEQRPSRKDYGWQAIVLWLNKEDDPGLGTLTPLTRKPASRLLFSVQPSLAENTLFLRSVQHACT